MTRTSQEPSQEPSQEASQEASQDQPGPTAGGQRGPGGASQAGIRLPAEKEAGSREEATDEQESESVETGSHFGALQKRIRSGF